MEEQQHLFKDTFLAAVLDQMDTNFYITDVETDEILYMNKTMKETFGLRLHLLAGSAKGHEGTVSLLQNQAAGTDGGQSNLHLA